MDIAVSCFSASIVAAVVAMLVLAAASRVSNVLLPFVMGWFWFFLLGSSTFSVMVLREGFNGIATGILSANAAFLLIGVGPRLRYVKTAPINRIEWDSSWDEKLNGEALATKKQATESQSELQQGTQPPNKRKCCALALVDTNPAGSFDVVNLPNGKQYRFARSAKSGMGKYLFFLGHYYEWTFRLQLTQVGNKVFAKTVAEGLYWNGLNPFQWTGKKRYAKAKAQGSAHCTIHQGECVATTGGSKDQGLDVEYWAGAAFSAGNSQSAGASLHVQVAASFSGQQVIQRLSGSITFPGGFGVAGPELTLPDNARDKEDVEFAFEYVCRDA